MGTVLGAELRRSRVPVELRIPVSAGQVLQSSYAPSRRPQRNLGEDQGLSSDTRDSPTGNLLQYSQRNRRHRISSFGQQKNKASSLYSNIPLMCALSVIEGLLVREVSRNIRVTSAQATVPPPVPRGYQATPVCTELYLDCHKRWPRHS